MGQSIEANGYGGSVSFDGQFVSIRRGGLGRLVVGKGEKRIPVRSISAVQMKLAGPMVNGFIEFSLLGGDERRSRFGRQTLDAVGDENSVIFTRKQQPAFEQLRAAVEAAIVAGAVPGPSQASVGLSEQRAQMAQLHQTGALSAEEFVAAKVSLLNQRRGYRAWCGHCRRRGSLPGGMGRRVGYSRRGWSRTLGRDQRRTASRT